MTNMPNPLFKNLKKILTVSLIGLSVIFGGIYICTVVKDTSLLKRAIKISTAENVLIISDTHLTDTFEQKKYDWLVDQIKSADTVIINGDFWDGFKTTFDSFVLSPWQQLFPLLKDKKTIYIEGNHDPFEKADSRVSLFSTQQVRAYEFTWKHKTIHVEHGNALGSIFNISKNRFWYKPILKIYDWIEKVGTTHMGYSFRAFFIDKWLDSVMIRQYIKNFPQDTVVIVGHTHWPVIDLLHNFVGSGAIMNGYASYIVIGDEIELRLGRYE